MWLDASSINQVYYYACDSSRTSIKFMQTLCCAFQDSIHIANLGGYQEPCPKLSLKTSLDPCTGLSKICDTYVTHIWHICQIVLLLWMDPQSGGLRVEKPSAWDTVFQNFQNSRKKISKPFQALFKFAQRLYNSYNLFPCARPTHESWSTVLQWLQVLQTVEVGCSC